MKILPQNTSTKREAGKTLQHLLNPHKPTVISSTLKGILQVWQLLKNVFVIQEASLTDSLHIIFTCWHSEGRKATDTRNTFGSLSSFQLRPCPQLILLSGTENTVNYNNNHSILPGRITEGSNFSCAHQSESRAEGNKQSKNQRPTLSNPVCSFTCQLCSPRSTQPVAGRWDWTGTHQ